MDGAVDDGKGADLVEVICSGVVKGRVEDVEHAELLEAGAQLEVTF